MLFKQILLTPLASIERAPTLQRYITEDERAPDVPEPAVPEVPKEYAINPHKYIKKLNWGRMPYELGSERPDSTSSNELQGSLQVGLSSVSAVLGQPAQECQVAQVGTHALRAWQWATCTPTEPCDCTCVCSAALCQACKHLADCMKLIRQACAVEAQHYAEDSVRVLA